MVDVLVVGLGAAGAAVCHEVARRGASVIGIDRHVPPHGLGSTHGRTRIIREAYFEHPLYVPLVQRAYELWSELEELSGSVLYRATGGLMVGPPDGVLVQGALDSARAHGLTHELLSSEAVRRRFPGLLPEAEWEAVLEPRAGILLPEAGVRTLLHLARGYGAELRLETNVTGWRVTAAGDVVIRTSQGDVSARHAVFTAGPWLNPLLAAEDTDSSPLQLPLRIERQLSHWFAPAPGVHAFRPDACPIAIWEYSRGRFFYTFPDLGHGVKAGLHHEGLMVDPDTVDRTVGTQEEQRMRWLLESYLPGSAHTAVDAAVCLYTNTPDGHFVIDAHPRHARVMVLSACSGHGFKFAPAIGEVAADELLEGGSGFDLTPFRIDRFDGARGHGLHR
jgi:sarcosine oxidase